MTVLGSGILVGTALSVIIPEGVNAIYESAHELAHQLAPPPKPDSPEAPPPKPQHEEVPHSAIGVTLVCGFVFMLLIDQFASRHSTSAAQSASSFKDGGESLLPRSESSSSLTLNGPIGRLRNRKSTAKITATIGLIVHAAADGVALGAAATTSHPDVEMIVFLAIMLHKAPAAFGLVTFLLHEGLDKHRIRRHLIAFSLSAPVAAYVTYFCIHLSEDSEAPDKSGGSVLKDYNATGMAMLFSAGTFLYVATVHVLPEITHHTHLKLAELLTLIGGAFLPLILTINHHH